MLQRDLADGVAESGSLENLDWLRRQGCSW